MPANYLHGVETIDVTDGVRQVTTAKSATTGMVGTAPVHLLNAAYQAPNVPRLVLSSEDAASYAGPDIPGFTLPQALAAHLEQGAGVIAMINVFDPATHKRNMTSKSVTFAGGVVAFDTWSAGVDISDPRLVISVALISGETTYVRGTDYDLDDEGNLIALTGGAIGPTGSANMTAVIADPSLVTAADIIGEVDGDGERSGLQALIGVRPLFSFKPYAIAAPGFSSISGVAAAMQVVANSLLGMAIVDAPLGATFTEVLSSRGVSGPYNMQASDERVVYTYPYLKAYRSVTDKDELSPYSARFSGLMAAVDSAEGFWVSPSNHQILGITGMELPLTASITDPNSQVNMLNAQGVVTVFSGYGTGYRAWGNRSSAYPASTHPYNFIAIRKTADIIGDSIEQACLQFMDMGINNAYIDQVKNSVSEYINTLVGRGALVAGDCWYNPAQNPVTEVSAGHLVWAYSITPMFPCERMTFYRSIDLSALATLGQ